MTHPDFRNCGDECAQKEAFQRVGGKSLHYTSATDAAWVSKPRPSVICGGAFSGNSRPSRPINTLWCSVS